MLLDFWATWCGPCRADISALDKLYREYGDKDLKIISISVDEDRTSVEKFLREHPRGYPVVLTTENKMPQQYQFGIVPTYVVIGRAGAVVSATDGDQGLGELRKLLRKAGVDAQ